jgi:hypothetical protein
MGLCAKWVWIEGSGFMVSHPFHDEAVEWMGHPNCFRATEMLQGNQILVGCAGAR